MLMMLQQWMMLQKWNVMMISKLIRSIMFCSTFSIFYLILEYIIPSLAFYHCAWVVLKMASCPKVASVLCVKPKVFRRLFLSSSDKVFKHGKYMLLLNMVNIVVEYLGLVLNKLLLQWRRAVQKRLFLFPREVVASSLMASLPSDIPLASEAVKTLVAEGSASRDLVLVQPESLSYPPFSCHPYLNYFGSFWIKLNVFLQRKNFE